MEARTATLRWKSHVDAHEGRTRRCSGRRGSRCVRPQWAEKPRCLGAAEPRGFSRTEAQRGGEGGTAERGLEREAKVRGKP